MVQSATPEGPDVRAQGRVRPGPGPSLLAGRERKRALHVRPGLTDPFTDRSQINHARATPSDPRVKQRWGSCRPNAEGRRSRSRVRSRSAPRVSRSPPGQTIEYSATLASKINPSKPKNVILLHRRRHGRLRGHARRATTARAPPAASTWTASRSAAARSTTCSVAGPRPAYAPNYVGDSRPDRDRVVDRQADDRRSPLAGPVQRPSTSRAPTPGTRPTWRSRATRGKATGNVSTAEITDATPAGPSSHISQRGCAGPDDTRTTCPTETKAAGGPRLDRRAAGRPGLRRLPRRRPRPLRRRRSRRPSRRRAGRSSTTPPARATRTSPTTGGRSHAITVAGGRQECSASSRRANMTTRVQAALRAHGRLPDGQPGAGPERQRRQPDRPLRRHRPTGAASRRCPR